MDATHETGRKTYTEHPSSTLGRLDARTLLPLLPHVDTDLLPDLRREVARRAVSTTKTSWQEAWNDITGASPNRPGQIRVSAHLRCRTCNGRRFGPTGVCHGCLGRGRTFTHITQTATWATPPEVEPAAQQR